MKKYVPLKYILGMIALFFVIPLSLILLIIFVIGFNDLTIAITIFLCGTIILLGPAAYYHNQESASIVIQNNTITNYMADSTLNHGWTEEIKNIKKIELVGKEEVRKYYKHFKSKKALLIDFGSHKIQYISVSLFTNKQIKQILGDIEDIKEKLQNEVG